jgi:hypothetical protein
MLKKEVEKRKRRGREEEEAGAGGCGYWRRRVKNPVKDPPPR